MPRILGSIPATVSLLVPCGWGLLLLSYALFAAGAGTSVPAVGDADEPSPLGHEMLARGGPGLLAAPPRRPPLTSLRPISLPCKVHSWSLCRSTCYMFRSFFWKKSNRISPKVFLVHLRNFSNVPLLRESIHLLPCAFSIRKTRVYYVPICRMDSIKAPILTSFNIANAQSSKPLNRIQRTITATWIIHRSRQGNCSENGSNAFLPA